MVGKEHDELLRDIKAYTSQMIQANKDSPKMDTPINPTDYFIESEYKDSTGQFYPCYKI